MNTKILKLTMAIVALWFATSATATAQDSRTMYIMKGDTIFFQTTVADIDSIIFYKPYIAVKRINLDKTRLLLAVDSVYTLTATTTPDDATNQSITWESSDNSIATVDANGKITAIADGTVIIIAMTENKTAACAVQVVASNNPLIYDVGVVINGIMWATRNVDAPGTFATNPEDAGMFYQWNRTVGWSSSDPLTSTDGSSWIKLEDYNNNSTGWETVNNVCPAGWHIPTEEEIQSLLNAQREWTPLNGKDGYHFRADGDAKLFLPAVGYRYNTGSLGGGISGLYWSSTGNSNYARFLSFVSIAAALSTYPCAYGLSVRCVADE